jgi:hypothetical protein
MHQVLAARFAVHSLLRMRAMGKLEWKRVNFEQRRAWIPGAHQKAGRTFSFPLTDELIRILRALRWLSPPASPYVFTWNGNRIDDFNTRSFQEAVKRAGVAPLRWHDLRHTGASWAVQAGVTLPELMMLGDWKDYRSVLVYAHLAPSHAAAAADRVAQWSHTQRSEPKRPAGQKAPLTQWVRWWSGRGSNPRPSHCERDRFTRINDLRAHSRVRKGPKRPLRCTDVAQRLTQ